VQHDAQAGDRSRDRAGRAGQAEGIVDGRGVQAHRLQAAAEQQQGRAGPATAPAATTRQRRERSRPSGTSRNGRVMASAMAGAHRYSAATAPPWAASGSGRPARTSSSTHGLRGTSSDQTRPAAAYSQLIGLAGSRSVSTSPMVANHSRNANASKAPAASVPAVSGRVTPSVTARPAAQQPKVASHSDQASAVAVRALLFTVACPRRSGRAAAAILLARRYGIVTTGGPRPCGPAPRGGAAAAGSPAAGGAAAARAAPRR
jgi:hypothetical protein